MAEGVRESAWEVTFAGTIVGWELVGSCMGNCQKVCAERTKDSISGCCGGWRKDGALALVDCQRIF